MKSVIHEASSLAKAIQEGWDKAGKPQEFTVKVFQEPESALFGLIVKKKAKVGIFFSESAQPSKDNRSGRQQNQRRTSNNTQRGERSDKSGYRPRRDASQKNTGPRGDSSDNGPRDNSRNSNPRENVARDNALRDNVLKDAPKEFSGRSPRESYPREVRPRETNPRETNSRESNSRPVQKDVLKDALPVQSAQPVQPVQPIQPIQKDTPRETPKINREISELRVLKPKTENGTSDKKVINAFVKK